MTAPHPMASVIVSYALLSLENWVFKNPTRMHYSSAVEYIAMGFTVSRFEMQW